MNVFSQSIARLFRGAAKSFQTYPVVLFSALAFAVVAIIRIHLDWPQQEAWNLLFNCLHWSLALGAVFSLATITAAQSRFNQKKYFILANLFGLAAIAATFVCLYFFAGKNPDPLDSASYAVIATLAKARVGVAMLVSFLVFIYLGGYPSEKSGFARSFFMTHKAFFIALIYGGVIMAGASGVAGAVQALLYHDMSEKVYMYIGTLTGFLAFAVFVGYFPDFRKGVDDPRREIAEKQPRFVEVLFDYILVPIVLALTVVLLLWAVKTIFGGMDTALSQLFAITAAFTLGGLWLHIMVTHHPTGLAKSYRHIFPFASLVILAFEAYAIFIRLSETGLKAEEYFYLLIWLLAAAAAILLLTAKTKAHPAIIAVTCILAIFAVLPGFGYQALPVKAQTDRLENLLVGQDMLEGDRIIPAAMEPEKSVRVAITDAVNYLAYAEDAKLPVWFDTDWGQSAVFAEQLGFEQTWPDQETNGPTAPAYWSVYLSLPAEAVDVGGYRWAINLQDYNKIGDQDIFIQGDQGQYRIIWSTQDVTGKPTLSIELEDRIILHEDFSDYIDEITAKFPPGAEASYQPTSADMSLAFSTPEITVLLVFRNIEISLDVGQDLLNYWFDPDALYLREAS